MIYVHISNLNMSIIPVFQQEVTGSGTPDRTAFLLDALVELDSIANRIGTTPLSNFCSYAKPQGARWFFMKYLSISGATWRYVDKKIAPSQNAQWFLSSTGCQSVSKIRCYLESYMEDQSTEKLDMNEFVADVVDELQQIEEYLRHASDQRVRFRLVIQERHTQSKTALRW